MFLSNTARAFSDSGVQDMPLYVKKKQVVGELSLTPGAVISVVGFLEVFSLQGRVYTTGRCRRCSVSIDLYAEECKKEPVFFFILQGMATIHIRGSL